MKIIIVGAKGMFGEACVRRCSEHQVEIEAVTRDELELLDLNAVESFIQALDYDVLIYAAAISGLEACLENPRDALRVNAIVPGIMAEISHQKNAKMVYISTDYVFDGEREGRPDEEAAVNPINAYGKSKREGEIRVLEKSPDALVCRVSWLFGRGRAGFVDQVIQTEQEGKVGNYIGNKYSIPNYCDDLADALWQLLSLSGEKSVTGILHLTNTAEPESWFSYAEKTLNRAIQLGLITSYSQDINNTDLDDVDFFIEKRPRYTAMISNRMRDELGIEIRNWQSGLTEFLQWKLDHDLTNG